MKLWKKALFGILMFVLLAGLSGQVSASSSSSDSDANYWHPYPSGLKMGDIVLGHSPDTDSYIPGYWTHAGIIGWYDSNIHDWIVIEAYYYVRLTPLREFMKRYDTFAVLRVRTDDTTRYYAVVFAYNQLGKSYSFKWWTKEVYADSYYCSELVWASYYWASNGAVDIDANPGWSWKYADGVAPQEIYDDSDTYVVYYHHA